MPSQAVKLEFGISPFGYCDLFDICDLLVRSLFGGIFGI